MRKSDCKVLDTEGEDQQGGDRTVCLVEISCNKNSGKIEEMGTPNIIVEKKDNKRRLGGGEKKNRIVQNGRTALPIF